MSLALSAVCVCVHGHDHDGNASAIDEPAAFPARAVEKKKKKRKKTSSNGRWWGWYPLLLLPPSRCPAGVGIGRPGCGSNPQARVAEVASDEVVEWRTVRFWTRRSKELLGLGKVTNSKYSRHNFLKILRRMDSF